MPSNLSSIYADAVAAKLTRQLTVLLRPGVYTRSASHTRSIVVFIRLNIILAT